MRAGNVRSDFVPSLAARVKHKLGIVNPKTVAYDLPFGCPGWLQGVIQANYYLKSGDCKRVMVIGAETLSRISDPHDRDSMIYADGAGATILEAVASEQAAGHPLPRRAQRHPRSRLHAVDGRSCRPAPPGDELYLKMDGHKLYEYALKTVPLVVKESLEKAGLSIGDIQKVLIHQANEKMDEAIVKRLFKICEAANTARSHAHDHLLAGQQLGRHGAHAARPAAQGQAGGPRPRPGRHFVLASVGAGMNINSVVYRLP